MEPSATAHRGSRLAQARPFAERISLSLAGPAAASALVRAGAAGAALLANVALARLLGARDYGTYAFLVSVITLAATVGKWGWDKASVRFVSQYLAQDERGALGHFLHARRRQTWLLSIVAALGCGLWVAASPLDVDLSSLLATMLLVPASVAALLLQSSLRGAAHSTLSEIPEGLVKPVVLVVGAATLLALLPALGALRAATLSLLLGSLASIALGLWLARHLPGAAANSDARTATNPWQRAVADYGMLGLAQAALTRLPIVIAGMLLPAEDLAGLAIAARLADVVVLAISSIGLVCAPRLSGHYHTGDIPRCREVLGHATRYSAIAGIALCGAMLLAGQPLLALFGSGFAAAYPLLASLCLAQVVAAILGPVGYVPTMSGHQRQALHVTAAGALAGALLTWLLAAPMGASGVCLALATASIGTNVMLALLARRILASAVPS